MHGFKRCNKVTGVHWLKDPVENLKIRIKLKPQDGIMLLPKFDDYTNDRSSVNFESFEQTYEHSFTWQEKVFSQWELNRYSNNDRCTTNCELQYHRTINETDCVSSKVFTYIHKDYYLPLPLNNLTRRNSMLDMITCFNRLNLSDRIGTIVNGNSISTRELFHSEEHLDVDEEEWKAMHIVFDNSEYNDEGQLIYKQEAILLSVYYNVINNYMLVSPDTNNLEMNPYTIETVAGVPLAYEYAVEVVFQDEQENADDLLTLLKKLSTKWEKKHKNIMNFSMPSIGKKLSYLTLEILSAGDFEEDDLYVEFNIKVPKEIICKDTLHGRTHVTKALKSDDLQQWNFGHIVELALEVPSDIEKPQIPIFFEVISTDWWGRHRTEGYSYLSLTLEPGNHRRLLSCSRPEESDRVQAESRRFFVGGCHLIKDMGVLVNPQLQDANFTYTTTGKLELRWQIINQSPSIEYLDNIQFDPVPSGSGSALLQGAEAVLKQYKRARARLAAATKDLGGRGDGLDDR